MTYAMVMAILVLALIAVITAVVFITDEEIERETDKHPADTPANPSTVMNEDLASDNEGNGTGDIGVMEFLEAADRDTRPVGIRTGSRGGLAG